MNNPTRRYHQILLISQEYGTEAFDYDSLEKAESDMERMVDRAEEETIKDGVKREVILSVDRCVIDPEDYGFDQD